jgi:hypothetical protein
LIARSGGKLAKNFTAKRKTGCPGKIRFSPLPSEMAGQACAANYPHPRAFL